MKPTATSTTCAASCARVKWPCTGPTDDQNDPAVRPAPWLPLKVLEAAVDAKGSQTESGSCPSRAALLHRGGVRRRRSGSGGVPRGQKAVWPVPT